MPRDRDKYRFINSKYKDLNFVQRGLDINRKSIPYGDKRASHRLAAEVDANGNWMVFPTIVEKDGELVEMGIREAMAYAKRTGEYIPFESKDEAIGYSKQGLIIHGGKNEGMPVGSLTMMPMLGMDIKTPTNKFDMKINKKHNPVKSKSKHFLEGGSIGGILQTIGGIGAMATGVGAGVGIPMIAGGIGKIASTEMAAAEQAKMPQMQVTPQNILNAQQQQIPLMQDGGVLAGVKNMPMKNAVTQYQGGNGKPDSIELGDVAMVDDGEVRVGDYVFSNHLKYDKENTFSKRVKSILKKYGWDEKKEEFKRPQDNATRNSLERELSGIIEKQEEKRMKKQESDDKRKMKYGGYVKKEYQDGGLITSGLGNSGLTGYVQGYKPRAAYSNEAFEQYVGGLSDEQLQQQAQAAGLGWRDANYARQMLTDDKYGPWHDAFYGGYSQSLLPSQIPSMDSGDTISTPSTLNTMPPVSNETAALNQQMQVEGDWADQELSGASPVDATAFASTNVPSDDSAGIPQASVNPLYSALGQVGNIYNIAHGLSGAEDVNFERVSLTPEEVSFAPARRAMERRGVAARRGTTNRISQTARSAGQALSNIGTTSAAIEGSIADALAGSYQREGNINAQMRQQASMREDLTNVDIANQEKIAEAQNRAKARDMIASGISGLGMGFAQYGRDVNAVRGENMRNAMMSSSMAGSFFEPVFDEAGNVTFKFKQ